MREGGVAGLALGLAFGLAPIRSGAGLLQAYTEETKRVSGGALEVVPLDVIAETAYRG